MSFSANFRTGSGRPIAQTLQVVRLKAAPLIGDALHQEARPIMRKSKTIVSVDTGALRDSGTVDRPVVDSKGIVVRLWYGGEGRGGRIPRQYAVLQHEDSVVSRNPFYLKMPFDEAKVGMGMRLANRVRGKLKRLGRLLS